MKQEIAFHIQTIKMLKIQYFKIMYELDWQDKFYKLKEASFQKILIRWNIKFWLL